MIPCRETSNFDPFSTKIAVIWVEIIIFSGENILKIIGHNFSSC
jgi:hypothetical protein